MRYEESYVGVCDVSIRMRMENTNASLQAGRGVEEGRWSRPASAELSDRVSEASCTGALKSDRSINQSINQLEQSRDAARVESCPELEAGLSDSTLSA